MSEPTVAVIIATLDERSNIDHVLDTALDCRNVIEVIVADGGSADGTVTRVAERASVDDRVTLIDNPYRVQSAGLNLAACLATADLLVRLDAHTTYGDGYVLAAVTAWQPKVAVGGPMRAIGSTPWAEATAHAMDEPLAIGPARFHHATEAEDVDTVYLGTFEREGFLGVGGYRTFPSGAVEDTDLYARWRAGGGTVRLDPTIVSFYHPRSRWRALFGQYLRYGRGKAELLWVNRAFPSLRPIAPAALVAAIAIGAAAAIAGRWVPLAVVAGAWFAVLAAIGVRAPGRRVRTAVVGATMHIAYGVGLWFGIVVGPPRIDVLGMAEAASTI
jgi:glycosyltransferase involved in cell wall biosynthesis